MTRLALFALLALSMPAWADQTVTYDHGVVTIAIVPQDAFDSHYAGVPADGRKALAVTWRVPKGGPCDHIEIPEVEIGYSTEEERAWFVDKELANRLANEIMNCLWPTGNDWNRRPVTDRK